MTPVTVIWQYGPQEFSDENWADSTFDPQLINRGQDFQETLSSGTRCSRILFI